jgi:DNA replication protein DnaC
MTMTTEGTRELERSLQELHLPTIRAQYAAVTRQAEAETWGYPDYLRELTQRAKVAQQLRGLVSGDFLDQRANVLVFGPPGSGKTHAVCAVAQELVRTGRRVLFTTCALLVQDLLAAKRDLTLKTLLQRLARYEALLLDDLGYVQQSREEMEVLFTLLAERYERGSVLLTSNLPFSKWEQIFKDPMTAAAAIDRLVHHSVIVELNVASYRVEAAKKTKGRTAE